MKTRLREYGRSIEVDAWWLIFRLWVPAFLRERVIRYYKRREEQELGRES